MQSSEGMISWPSIVIVSTCLLAEDPRAYSARVEVRWPEDECDCIARAQAGETRASERPRDPAPASPDPPDAEAASEPGAESEKRRRRAELDLSLTGLLGVFGSRGTGGFTFGGPRIGLLVGKFAIGLSFYPSLSYSTYRDEHRIRAHLGFGLEVAWRGITLFAPVYYIEDNYVPAVGLGYRFHLTRKINGRDRERKRRRAK